MYKVNTQMNPHAEETPYKLSTEKWKWATENRTLPSLTHRTAHLLYFIYTHSQQQSNGELLSELHTPKPIFTLQEILQMIHYKTV